MAAPSSVALWLEVSSWWALWSEAVAVANDDAAGSSSASYPATAGWWED
jgi:hypothetical protein